MAIKLNLAAEEYDAAMHAEDYTQLEDGSYRLTELVNGRWESGEDVEGLRSAVKKERQNARESFKKFKELEDRYGQIDLADYAAMQVELAKLREQAAADPQALAKAEKTSRTLEHALHLQLKRTAIMEASDEHRALHKLLLPQLQDKVKVAIEGNEARAYIEHNDSEISVSEYVGLLREAAYDNSDPLFDDSLPHCFSTNMKKGGGTPPGSGTTGRTTVKLRTGQLRRSRMTRQDKVAFIKKHGEEGFLKLPH